MAGTTEGQRSSRSDRIEIAQAIVLSIATVATAWCGYQAALWSGIQSIYFTQAGARRVEAARMYTTSGQWALADILIFNRWLDAEITGNASLADLYRRRFRPGFVPAFEAWKRLDPVRNPDANAGPLALPEYEPKGGREARALESEAERLFEKGKRANATSDIYVQTTVLLALVLFFMGVAPRFDVLKVRLAMTAFGALVLLLAIVRIFTLPVASS